MQYARLLCTAGAIALISTSVTDAATREIPVTYRDFAGTDTMSAISDPPSMHPDFENEDAFCWNVTNQVPSFLCGGLCPGVQLPECIIPELGIVAATLGVDGKPVYVGGGGDTTTGAANFASWYNDDAALNVSIMDVLTLADNNDGIFIFDSSAFFPIDGRGFGDTIGPVDGLPTCGFTGFCNQTPPQLDGHNWHFTMEMHTEFTYQGGETFDYEGDDDLWVYIDGKLVIDLGGVHNPLPASIALDTLEDVGGTPVALMVGETYSFDLFYAERHHNESNLKVTTSILIGDEPCFGDIDMSGSVGFNDLTLLLGLWGPCPVPTDPCGAADLDQTDSVGFNDLTLLLGSWGPCK